MARRHDLDALRVAAFGLLVPYHVGMYYVGWDWHVKSPFAGEALEPLMLLTAPWRLALLFLVSGAATAFLLDKAPRGFLRGRSWRLLLPLLFGMLVVVPPQLYFELLEKATAAAAAEGGYLRFWLRYLRGGDLHCRAPGDCLDAPSWNHLWFVAYLWTYTVLAWAVARLAPGALARLRGAGAAWFAGTAALWAPMAVLVLARLALVARFESTHDLVDDWYNHAQYLAVFGLGFVLARADGFWRQLQHVRWLSAALALASYAVLAWYFAGPGSGDEVPFALRTVQRVAWGVNQWSAIAAACGFAYRFRDADSAALRYLVPAVFPVYILHQTVIVVAAVRLRPLALPPLLEGPLLIVLTFAACFAGYELIRRISVLGPLFGLGRAPRVEPLAAARAEMPRGA